MLGILPGTKLRWFDGERPQLPERTTRYLELMQIIASRTLQTRYRGTILGVFWSLSNPLIMTAVYAYIFGTAFSTFYHGSVTRYIFATFVALGVYGVFASTSSQALSSVVANGGLLNKVRLPFSIFPLSNVAANFFQFFVGTFPVLCIVTAVSSRSAVNVVALAVPTVALIMVVVGFSLVTSALYVYFRDLPFMYEVLLFVIMMTSPIFYPLALVPAKVQAFLAFNPIIWIVSSFRQIALTREWPDPNLMLASLASGVVCLTIGAIVFSLLRRDFMDLL